MSDAPPLTKSQVRLMWKERVVARSVQLDKQSDRGGHDWHSLWTGFVIGLGRSDLTSWKNYMAIGFPEE